MNPLHGNTATTLSLALLALAPTPTATAHRNGSSTDGDVVSQWNAIAVDTIFVENLTPIPSGQVHFGFVSSAVYDAVRDAGRTRKSRAPGSVTAAVATAAHDVLVEYFPTSAAALDADLAGTLADVSDGRRTNRGIRIGAAAADELIEDRVGDGMNNTSITLDVTLAPGVWRPTSPNTQMAVPWLGFVEPLLLDSPTQIRLGGPDDLDSRQYAKDVAEVRSLGADDSTTRTDAQTETALFWNDNVVRQYQDAMRDLVDREEMSAREAARMFAAVNMTSADSIIACWRAKYDEAYWRPVTAIREAASDGNPRTTADAGWTPLVPSPPYPEYPSGHACLTGAMGTGIAQLAGSDHIDLFVASAVTGTTRHFTSARQMIREAFNARIWLGIHFRTAMEDGRLIGKKASRLGFGELRLSNRRDNVR